MLNAECAGQDEDKMFVLNKVSTLKWVSIKQYFFRPQYLTVLVGLVSNHFTIITIYQIKGFWLKKGHK